MRRVAFRVDASAKIGTGHLMRCLTLADALRERGVQARFVCRHLPDHMAEALVARTHEIAKIASPAVEESIYDGWPYGDWLGTTQLADASATFKALCDREWDGLVVDHYALDASWERRLRDVAPRILAIDDIANRSHGSDWLLDQNYYSDMDTRYKGKVSGRCEQLLGPRYALIRESFRHMRDEVRPRVGEVKRALIFFGGVDTKNFTSLAVRAFAEVAPRNIHLDVVIGAQHPQNEEVKSQCALYGFRLHVETSRMAELMAAADLAIGAAGSSAWERCCLGLPTLTVSLADNQIDIARGVQLLGAGMYLGTSVDVTLPVMREAIGDALRDTARLESQSECAYSIVDGRGAIRVSDVIIN